MGTVVSLRSAEKRQLSLAKVKEELKKLHDSLDERTIEEKVDILAHTRAVRKAAEEIEEICCNAVKRQRKAVVDGIEYTATRSEYPTERLDIEQIRADMSNSWIAKYTVNGSCVKILTKLKGFLQS